MPVSFSLQQQQLSRPSSVQTLEPHIHGCHAIWATQTNWSGLFMVLPCPTLAFCHQFRAVVVLLLLLLLLLLSSRVLHAGDSQSSIQKVKHSLSVASLDSPHPGCCEILLPFLHLPPDFILFFVGQNPHFLRGKSLQCIASSNLVHRYFWLQFKYLNVWFICVFISVDKTALLSFFMHFYCIRSSYNLMKINIIFVLNAYYVFLMFFMIFKLFLLLKKVYWHAGTTTAILLCWWEPVGELLTIIIIYIYFLKNKHLSHKNLT